MKCLRKQTKKYLGSFPKGVTLGVNRATTSFASRVTSNMHVISDRIRLWLAKIRKAGRS